MKKFKKIIVAIMAMALALGMLTMTASAAEDPGELYAVGEINGWKHEKMESKGNGIYTITVELEAGKYEYKFTTEAGWPGSDNTTCIEINDGGNAVGGGALILDAKEAGKYTITVDYSKIEEGGDAQHLSGTNAVTVTSGDVPAGDVAPIIAVSSLALVALAGVIVCLKKRTVTE